MTIKYTVTGNINSVTNSMQKPIRRAARLTSLFFLATIGVFANAATSLDPQTFALAVQTASEMPRLHSLLISHDGEIVVEEYFNGRRANQAANVKSVSKSFMSALIGIAIEQGYVSGLDQPITDYYDELLDAADAQKRDITVGDLLSMRAGLESTSFRNYGAWVLSDDWIRFALQQPLESPPGSRMRYSTGNTHLLSGILTRATGMSTMQFAKESLTRPLGIQLASWQTDPNGIYFGGNNMEFTPRHMLQFGELYLNAGRVAGQQIIPEKWVNISTQRLVESSREKGRYYGYGWWSRDIAEVAVNYAWGYGGQFIMIAPALDLVIVTTSSTQADGGSRPHTRNLYKLLEQQVVLPAATNNKSVTTD